MDKVYVDTVRLLLEIAPVIFKSPDFAIKGGTALNLFLHNMPRLSVDIDVVYTDHRKDRSKAISNIADSLKRAKDEIIQLGLQCELSTTNGAEESRHSQDAEQNKAKDNGSSSLSLGNASDV